MRDNPVQRKREAEFEFMYTRAKAGDVAFENFPKKIWQAMAGLTVICDSLPTGRILTGAYTPGAIMKPMEFYID